jgi:hypothetical protein
MTASIKKTVSYEDSAITLLARVRTADYALLRDVGVDHMDISVHDLHDTTPAVYTEHLDHDDISNDPYRIIIHDELQHDGRWTVDEQGFNFEFVLSPDALPEGDTTYRVEVKIEPTSGERFYLIYDIDTIDLLST